MFLLFALACAGSPTSVTAPAAPTTTPTPVTTPAALPDADALLAAGLCTEEKAIVELRTVHLDDGRTMQEAVCARYAYQEVVQYSWAHTPGPVGTTLGQPLSVVGVPRMDAKGALSWLSKARGPGDCGHFYRYQIDGDALRLVELRGRECTDEPPAELDPSTWPLLDHGHCGPNDAAYFSCPVSGGKHLSLCGASKAVWYAFGPVGKPELRLDSGITVADRTMLRAKAWVATATVGEVSYEVTESVGSGARDGAANNFSGVRVLKGDKVLATIPCTAAPVSSWTSLTYALER